jgi:hypothetical protein
MLARRLMSHESAEIVLAGLLRDHLGTRPEAAAAAAESRRARTPSSSANDITAPPSTSKSVTSPAVKGEQSVSPLRVAGAESDRRRRQRKRESSEPEVVAPERVDEFDFKYTVKETEAGSVQNTSERSKREDAPQATSPAISTGKSEGLEIFLSLGRRDGVSPDDVVATLQASAIAESAVTHVSVRHHHTFVGVSRACFDAALQALDGAHIAGRLARAEPAKSGRP